MKAHFRSFQMAALAAAALFLSGCAETQLVSHWAKKVAWSGQEETSGVYKVGNPYKIGSVWYYPKENFRMVETGIASWYGPGFHEGQTANGEIFDQNELTAAHRTLQMPSLARVTNLENGRSVVVRVNDRGPFKNGRVMDLSQRAAELLGFIDKGTARVRIEVLEKESRILASAAKRGENTARLTFDELRGREAEAVAVAAAPKAPDVIETPPQIASAGFDGDAAMPESLRTPTITVEELKAPGKSAPAPAPAQDLAAGRIQSGRFMPDPVISTSPVLPTGIFVQAGSFAVYDNAARLAKGLNGIAPTVIEPVTVNARKMYRVKLGPMPSVDAADTVLEKVIQSGQGAAKVVHTKKS